MSFTAEEDCICEFCQAKVDRFHRVERWIGARLHVFCFPCDERFKPGRPGKTIQEGGGRIGKQLRLDNAASGKRATDPIQDAGGEGGGQPPLLKKAEGGEDE